MAGRAWCRPETEASTTVGSPLSEEVPCLWDCKMYPRPGTDGMYHGIPRYQGTMGQGDLVCSQTWDWWDILWDPKVQGTRSMYFRHGTWDVPWDPKAPWDNGTSQSPSGHSTARLDNKGLGVCISDLEFGKPHGIPTHHGTMGRPKVPVDILQQSWTTKARYGYTCHTKLNSMPKNAGSPIKQLDSSSQHLSGAASASIAEALPQVLLAPPTFYSASRPTRRRSRWPTFSF